MPRSSANHLMVATHIATLLLALLCTSVDSFSPLQSGTWAIHNHTYTGRDKFGLAMIGSLDPNCDVGIVVGGRETSSKYIMSVFNVTFCAAPVTGDITIEEQSQLFPVEEPLPRAGFQAFGMLENNDTVVIFGGNLDATTVTNDVALLNIPDRVWSHAEQEPAVVDGDVPWPRAKYGAVRLSSTEIVYFFGITAQAMSDEVWHMRIESGRKKTVKWTLLSGNGTITTKQVPATSRDSVPIARFDPCCVFSESQNATYCFGGTTSEGDVSETWRFDHATNAWRRLSTTTEHMPSNRRLAQCALNIDKNSLIVFSGWDSKRATYINDGNSTTFQLVLQSNPVLVHTWYSRIGINNKNIPGYLPFPRDSAQMTLLPNVGRILLTGGNTDYARLGRQNDVWDLAVTATHSDWKNYKYETLRPASRVYHSSTVVGSRIMVAFGHDKNAVALEDVWAFDTVTDKWSLRNDGPPSDELGLPHGNMGRYGSSVVAIGTSLFFFGGILADETYTSDLISYNDATGSWSRVSTRGDLPTARAHHGAVLLNLTDPVMVILGGSDRSKHTISTAFAFEVHFGIWRQLFGAEAIKERSHVAMMLDITNEDVLVIGGFNDTTTFFDRWRLTNFSQNRNGSQWDVIATQISPADETTSITPADLANGATVRDFIRAEAAVAGSGSHVMVCGGSISWSFPAPLDSTCYYYNRLTGLNGKLPSTPLAVVGATAEQVGTRLFVFGGQLAADSIKRTEVVSHLQVLSLSDTSMCTSAVGSKDSTCMHCSPGTLNSGFADAPTACALAPPGSWGREPFSFAVQCPVGQFSDQNGAQTASFCRLCPAGSFALEAGSSSCTPCNTNITCRLGASNLTIGEAESSTAATNSSIVANPRPFEEAGTPFTIYFTLLGLLVFGVITLYLVDACRKRVRRNARLHVLGRRDSPLRAKSILLKAFDGEVKSTDPGITWHSAWLVMWSPKVREITRGIDHLSSEEFHKIFVQNETNGTGVLSKRGFLSFVVDLIQQGKLRPIRGTGLYKENEEYVKWWDERYVTNGEPHQPNERDLRKDPRKELKLGCCSLVKVLFWKRLAQFDGFSSRHAFFANGAPLTVRETNLGAKCTMVQGLIILIAIALLSAQFVEQNLFETKGTVPAVAVTEEIVGELFVDFFINTNPADGDLREACISTNSSSPTGCNEDNAITLSSSEFGVTGGSIVDAEKKYACSYEPGQCKISFYCARCGLLAGQTAELMLSTNPALYAYHMDIQLTSDTGIRDQNGTKKFAVIDAKVAAGDSFVFRGYPAAVVDALLVPTRFTTIDNVVYQQDMTSLGYHAQLNEARPGHQVTQDDFNQFFGTPAVVKLSRSDTVYVVRRSPNQSQLDFISSMLGTISGIGALILVIVRKLDEWYSDDNTELYDTAIERENGNGSPTNSKKKPRTFSDANKPKSCFAACREKWSKMTGCCMGDDVISSEEDEEEDVEEKTVDEKQLPPKPSPNGSCSEEKKDDGPGESTSGAKTSAEEGKPEDGGVDNAGEEEDPEGQPAEPKEDSVASPMQLQHNDTFGEASAEKVKKDESGAAKKEEGAAPIRQHNDLEGDTEEEPQQQQQRTEQSFPDFENSGEASRDDTKLNIITGDDEITALKMDKMKAKEEAIAATVQNLKWLLWEGVPFAQAEAILDTISMQQNAREDMFAELTGGAPRPNGDENKAPELMPIPSSPFAESPTSQQHASFTKSQISSSASSPAFARRIRRKSQQNVELRHSVHQLGLSVASAVSSPSSRYGSYRNLKQTISTDFSATSRTNNGNVLLPGQDLDRNQQDRNATLNSSTEAAAFEKSAEESVGMGARSETTPYTDAEQQQTHPNVVPQTAAA